MKVYASLIRHIVACSFRLMGYCFGTWIKERVKFMCSVLVSAHVLYCFGTLIKERIRFMCSVLVSVQGLLFRIRHID